MSNEELEIIQKVAARIARRYKIAYYDTEDIEQEIVIWSIEALKKYDGRVPLEHFLSVNAKHRCLSLRRQFDRSDIGESSSPNVLRARQDKKNLLSPLSLDAVDPTNEKSLEENDDSLEHIEFLEMIDACIPISLRRDFIKYKNGVKISLCKIKKIQEAVVQILQERKEF